jgi:hypothetical protein
MPFGSGNRGIDGRTQADLVEESVPARPDLVESELKLPGLEWILSMSEEELVEFFTVVLKSRSNIREIDFSLGDYQHKELQSRVPGSKNIHEKSFEDAARVITMALQQDPKVVGVRVRITKVNDDYVSLVHVKIADKEPQGPERIKGKLVKGDAEYNPRLVLYHTSSM